MATFTYMSNASLTMIGMAYQANLNATDPIFQQFPIKNGETNVVTWKQKDYAKGRMQIRGLNGHAPRVSALGDNTYLMQPGYYGEHVPIDETAMTIRSANTDFTKVINIDTLVMDANYQLEVRQGIAQRQVLWDLVTKGYFSVLDANGTISHAGSWNQKVLTSAVSYSNLAAATPFADLLSLPILARGYSVNLGSAAKVYGNQQTINNIVNNQNPLDFGKKFILGGASVNSLADVNLILGNQGLPSLNVWDEGWYDDFNTFQLNIPNNTLVVFGKRLDNDPLGSFTLTTGVGGGPSSYTKVIDKTGPNDAPPPSIQVHKGFNGGPELHYPNAIIRIAC